MSTINFPLLSLDKFFISFYSDDCLIHQGSEESRTRLRNDSYIGAISRENMLVRAGLQVSNLHPYLEQF